MKELSQIVADNQRRLRSERGLSLEALARISDVSKTRLSQIERGEANPSMATLWQIANALGVVFSELVTPHEPESHLRRREDAPPVTTDDGRCRTYMLFPFESTYGFEYYASEFDPDGTVAAEPHPAGTQETITMMRGELQISTSAETVTLRPGDVFRFLADQEHVYTNMGPEQAEFLMIVAYPRRS